MALDDQISSIKVQIGREQFTIGEMLHIDPDSISEEFSKQSARLAWAGVRLADAEASLELTKSNKEIAYAEADSEAREALANSDVKVTEAMIKSVIVTDDLYMKACEEERTALYNYRVIRAIVDAIRQRGDMLVSLGATLRQEYDALGMSVSERVKTKLRDK